MYAEVDSNCWKCPCMCCIWVRIESDMIELLNCKKTMHTSHIYKSSSSKPFVSDSPRPKSSPLSCLSSWSSCRDARGKWYSVTSNRSGTEWTDFGAARRCSKNARCERFLGPRASSVFWTLIACGVRQKPWAKVPCSRPISGPLRHARLQKLEHELHLSASFNTKSLCRHNCVHFQNDGDWAFDRWHRWAWILVFLLNLISNSSPAVGSANDMQQFYPCQHLAHRIGMHVTTLQRWQQKVHASNVTILETRITRHHRHRAGQRPDRNRIILYILFYLFHDFLFKFIRKAVLGWKMWNSDCPQPSE